MHNSVNDEPGALSPFEQAEVDRWTAYEKLQHGLLVQDEGIVSDALATIDQSFAIEPGAKQ